MLRGAPLPALSELLFALFTVTVPVAMFAALFCLVAVQVARREQKTFELTDGLLFGVAGGALGAVVQLLWSLRAAPPAPFMDRWPLVAPTLLGGLVIGACVGGAVSATAIWRDHAREVARSAARRNRT